MMTKAPLFAVSFRGGDGSQWRVSAMTCVAGEPLAPVSGMDIVASHLTGSASWPWVLRGTAGHVRYTKQLEVQDPVARKPEPGRAGATSAALIPIRKTDAWWLLAQDERRQIMEEDSHHIAQSMKYLPAIARRLYHSRDLGEPFDFLTWFEFAPEHSGLFDALVAGLRATREWDFVDREVDIRLACA